MLTTLRDAIARVEREIARELPPSSRSDIVQHALVDALHAAADALEEFAARVTDTAPTDAGASADAAGAHQKDEAI